MNKTILKINYKVLVLTASLSRNAGGLYDSIRFLCLSLRIKPKVFGLQDVFTKSDSNGWGSLLVKSFKIKGFTSFGFSPTLHKAVLKEKSADIIHLHGLWMFPQFTALKWQRQTKKNVIITPHGMLDPWAMKNSRFKKYIIWFLFVSNSLRKADCIHALCYSEFKSIRDLGLKNPVAIIPNGINLPIPFIKEKNDHKKKTLLFIGRIHPKKGLTLLLEALHLLVLSGSDFLKNWKVDIIGWDQENHLDYLKNLQNEYHLESHINFLGPLFNDEKTSMLKSADAFILPSYSEGLPMSILEAWSYKLPVLMTKECNLPDGFSSNSAIELELSSKNISAKLDYLNFLEESEIIEIGRNGFNLVSQKFTWDKIAKDMAKTYNWVLTKKNKPKFIN